jgi:hypothetical protein
MEPSPCTPPHRELSKDTKNTIWSILVRWISYLQNRKKQNKLPSFIDRCWCKFEEISNFDNVDEIFYLTYMEGNTLFLDWSLLANPTELNEDLSTFVQDSHLQTWKQFCSMRQDCNKHILPRKFQCSVLCTFFVLLFSHLNLKHIVPPWT